MAPPTYVYEVIGEQLRIKEQSGKRIGIFAPGTVALVPSAVEKNKQDVVLIKCVKKKGASVQLDINWFYRPNEAPTPPGWSGGKWHTPAPLGESGAAELLLSNHKDTIEACSLNSVANVSYVRKAGDKPTSGAPFVVHRFYDVASRTVRPLSDSLPSELAELLGDAEEEEEEEEEAEKQEEAPPSGGKKRKLEEAKPPPASAATPPVKKAATPGPAAAAAAAASPASTAATSLRLLNVFDHSIDVAVHAGQDALGKLQGAGPGVVAAVREAVSGLEKTLALMRRAGESAQKAARR